MPLTGQQRVTQCAAALERAFEAGYRRTTVRFPLTLGLEADDERWFNWPGRARQMALRDMSQFMGHHGGKFCLGARRGDQAGKNGKPSPGPGKRVDESVFNEKKTQTRRIPAKTGEQDLAATSMAPRTWLPAKCPKQVESVALKTNFIWEERGE